jgi:hypothetical protein
MLNGGGVSLAESQGGGKYLMERWSDVWIQREKLRNKV